jgi:pilus assembly protein Flp/PilA
MLLRQTNLTQSEGIRIMLTPNLTEFYWYLICWQSTTLRIYPVAFDNPSDACDHRFYRKALRKHKAHRGSEINMWFNMGKVTGFILEERRISDMQTINKERGQGMVEYALILVLVAVISIAALTVMGPLVEQVFSTINASL